MATKLKDNVVFRLVFRSFLNIFFAAILSLVGVALLYVVALFLSSNFRSFWFLRDLGVFFINDLPYALGLWFIWVLLFCVCFFILQWVQFSAFGKINDTVRQIADGQLEMNHQITVRQRSGFGVLARNVNRLSDRLQHALEEERRAEQAKNELITNVSHDLRTPLTSVVGYLGLIEQDRYRDEVELRHYIAIAYKKSQHLHELIDDLFEYTRMRHDTIALKLEPINLVEMLGQLLVQYHMPLEEVGMVSQLHSEEKQITVRADAGKLARVFENLISNAMSYGREGKRIDVWIALMEGKVSVAIVNYGEPISAIDLPHIFDRFYRADKSRTRWSGGSGLGLAISKSIVEKHGGAIDADSNTERTVFRVILPLQ
ncbi:cell wall metabolism sensor histidine kinase WalK [Paenibacillus sp. 1011MAR3C5]|uniref:sensor histidine kinase n=1 Tax=Paenibacillus sp. 1011MAR3C5 TaxID=1675787 RepID=UPI002175C7FA|nr:ATP-binding protein [Paenibacillus sp. 1011MAR3C5]